MENRREYPRVPCEINSAFRTIGETTPKPISETVVHDISEGGVRFRANQFIPVHQKLLLRLNIPGHKTIEAVAQPAWIREIPAISQFDIGAKFLTLSEEDKKLIRQFVGTF